MSNLIQQKEFTAKRSLIGGGIGAVAGSGSAALSTIGLKKRLKEENPELSEEEMDKLYKKALKNRVSLGAGSGAAAGALIGSGKELKDAVKKIVRKKVNSESKKDYTPGQYLAEGSGFRNPRWGGSSRRRGHGVASGGLWGARAFSEKEIVNSENNMSIIRRKVYSIAIDEAGETRYFSTTEKKSEKGETGKAVVDVAAGTGLAIGAGKLASRGEKRALKAMKEDIRGRKELLKEASGFNAAMEQSHGAKKAYDRIVSDIKVNRAKRAMRYDMAKLEQLEKDTADRIGKAAKSNKKLYRWGGAALATVGAAKLASDAVKNKKASKESK